MPRQVDLLYLDINLPGAHRPAQPQEHGNYRDKVARIGAAVDIAIDDHSWIAFSAIYPDKTRASVLHQSASRATQRSIAC